MNVDIVVLYLCHEKLFKITYNRQDNWRAVIESNCP